MKLFFGGPSEPSPPAASAADVSRSLRPDTADVDVDDTIRDLDVIEGTTLMPDWAAWNLTFRTRAPSIDYR